MQAVTHIGDSYHTPWIGALHQNDHDLPWLQIFLERVLAPKSLSHFVISTPPPH